MVGAKAQTVARLQPNSMARVRVKNGQSLVSLETSPVCD